MTAEIAILNSSGVALAADSAMTVDVQTPKSQERKIYNGSNKLFALSKFHPVGIMVFGSASLLGLPWEIIIKNYRNNLWQRQFPTLFDYSDDFLRYLQKLIPKEEQEDYFENNVSGFLTVICDDIKNKVEKATCNSQKISLSEIKKITSDSIEQFHQSLLRRSRLTHLPEDFQNKLIDNRKNKIDQIVKDVFNELPISSKNRILIIEIVKLLFISDIFPDDYSGVVIAGYGKDDNLPSVIEIRIDGLIDDVVKYSLPQKETIDYKSNAIIVPFAHKDMIFSFMEGVHPTYQNLLEGTLSDIFNEYPRTLLDKITHLPQTQKDSYLKVLQDIGIQAKKEILQSFKDYRKSEFIDPVLDAVGVLPKDELALMAETLVNLTSFKQRMSLDEETVGGPIDVAIISKGDGFIWIKRKDYFKPELNHHYFKNYFQNQILEEELS